MRSDFLPDMQNLEKFKGSHHIIVSKQPQDHRTPFPRQDIKRIQSGITMTQRSRTGSVQRV